MDDEYSCDDIDHPNEEPASHWDVHSAGGRIDILHAIRWGNLSPWDIPGLKTSDLQDWENDYDQANLLLIQMGLESPNPTEPEAQWDLARRLDEQRKSLVRDLSRLEMLNEVVRRDEEQIQSLADVLSEEPDDWQLGVPESLLSAGERTLIPGHHIRFGAHHFIHHKPYT